VASALRAPLDVLLVRKLGVPGREELAMGAVASGGPRVINEDIVRGFGLPDDVIDAVEAQEQQELTRRERLYRDDLPPPDLRGRTIILVDDGLATGASMRAAVQAARQQQPARIIVAVPTASPDTCEALKREADDVISVILPEPFFAVGQSYDDFSQTTDNEVRDLLARQHGAEDARAEPSEDSSKT